MCGIEFRLLWLNSLCYLLVGLWGAASRGRSISVVRESSRSCSNVSSDQEVAAAAARLCLPVHRVQAARHRSSDCRETCYVHGLLHKHQRFVGMCYVATVTWLISPACKLSRLLTRSCCTHRNDRLQTSVQEVPTPSVYFSIFAVFFFNKLTDVEVTISSVRQFHTVAYFPFRDGVCLLDVDVQCFQDCSI